MQSLSIGLADIVFSPFFNIWIHAIRKLTVYLETLLPELSVISRIPFMEFRVKVQMVDLIIAVKTT